VELWRRKRTLRKHFLHQRPKFERGALLRLAPPTCSSVFSAREELQPGKGGQIEGKKGIHLIVPGADGSNLQTHPCWGKDLCSRKGRELVSKLSGSTIYLVRKGKRRTLRVRQFIEGRKAELYAGDTSTRSSKQERKSQNRKTRL